MKTAKNIDFIKSYRVPDDELETQTTYVRYSSTITTPPDVSTEDSMNAVESSGTLDFWNEPDEDIYGPDDGDAV